MFAVFRAFQIVKRNVMSPKNLFSCTQPNITLKCWSNSFAVVIAGNFIGLFRMKCWNANFSFVKISSVFWRTKIRVSIFRQLSVNLSALAKQ